MASPTLSVVVPVWNEAFRLPRLLDALDRCSPPPDEVIVADGGSTDGTLALAGPRSQVVQAPLGRGPQQNAGVRAAIGDTLWFLHADSVPPPDAVAQIRSALRTGAAGGCFRIAFAPEERRRRRLLGAIETGINARTRATRTGTGDQGIFIRREAFEELGGFPPWPLFEDVSLFGRLRRAGEVAVCRGPLVISARRWIRGGVARTMLRMWALRLGYWLGVSPERLAQHWLQGPLP